MLKLFDKKHNAIGHIRKYKDLKIEGDVSTGDKTLSFTYMAKTHDIEPEYYVQTQTDEYVIREKSHDSDGFPKFVATLNLEELEGKAWKKFQVTDSTIADAARLALAGTGWTVKESKVTKKRNAGMLHVSSLGVIDKLCTAFMCERVYDTINKTVSFYEKVGKDKGVYFLRGLNLKKLSAKSDTYDYYTVIMPVGANGLGIASVNNGKEYLENFQYSSKVKMYIWKDESYTDAQALKEDAELKLADLSKPIESYSAQVRDLAKQKEGYSLLSYEIGDSITLIDEKTGTRKQQRIVKLTEYPDDPEKNTCELANAVLTFEDLQQQLQAANAIISNVVSSDGQYTGTVDIKDILHFEEGLEGSQTIGNIQTDLSQVKVTLGQVETNYLKAEEADIKYATIAQLNVTNETVHSIEGDYASFKSTTTEEFSAHRALIDSVSGDLADYKKVVANELQAIDGEFNSLSTKYAMIDLANIAQGAIKTAMIDVGAIQTAQIADGAITDLKVAGNLDAAKITVGTLSVDRLVIRGSEKSIVYQLNNITGALQAQNADTLNGEILTPRTITADKIVANSITGNEIAAKTITANNIVANSITGAEIAANAITAAKIASGAITTNKLAANAVTAAKIDVTDLFAQDITATGTIRGVNLVGATGSFSGSVTAKTGTIGGWYLNSTRILSAEGASMGTTPNAFFIINESDRPFIAATNSSGTTIFQVSRSGALTATAGKIGGWTIGTKAIYSDATLGDGKDSYVTISNNFYTAGNAIPYDIVFGTKYDGTWRFYVRSNGALYANNATISGNITATGGTIGGWTISSSSIRSSSPVTEGTASTQYDTVMGRYASATGSAFLVRSRTYNGSEYGDWTTNFQVRYDGKMIANNATVKGTITATAGKVGVFNIDSALYTSTNAFGTTANNIYIGSSGISLGTNFQVTKAGTLTAVNAILKNVLYMRSTDGTTNKKALSVEGNGDVTTLTVGAGYTQVSLSPYVVMNGATSSKAIQVTGMVTASSGFGYSANRVDIACNSTGLVYIGNSGLTYKSIVIDPENGYLRPSVSGNYSLGSSTYKFHTGHFSSECVSPKWTTSSKAEIKQDIKPYAGDALSIIGTCDVYTYRLKEDAARGSTYRNIGFVIGDGYRLAEALLSEDREGVNTYAGLAIAYAGIKKLIESSVRADVRMDSAEAQLAALRDQLFQAYTRITQLEQQVTQLQASAA